MTLAIVMKGAAKEEQGNAVPFTVVKRCLTSWTLLIRWSASVLKWACHTGSTAYKRRLAYSVTLRINF